MKCKTILYILTIIIQSVFLVFPNGRSKALNAIPSSSGITERISLSENGEQGNEDSRWPRISSNGRYIVFESKASNLVMNDTNGVDDIFLYDRTVNSIQRVSVSSSGLEGNGGSPLADISDDGRYVVIYSVASNLVPNDTNGCADVFIRDTTTNSTDRISEASDGTQGNNISGPGHISSDGSIIVYSSYATNLVPNDTNNAVDIFVYYRETGQTQRVSVDSNGAESNGDSTDPAISGDGKYVIFVSQANNLVTNDTNEVGDVFIHNLTNGITERVSVSTNGTEGNLDSYNGAISYDGRYVVFWSWATNLIPNDSNGTDEDILLRDRLTATTVLVSVSSEGIQGNERSMDPAISYDGRYIGFVSYADNLVPNDTNGATDVFIHDIYSGKTVRASVASDGTQGNGASGASNSSDYISGDGHYIVFDSYASNLVLGDTNGFRDVFFFERSSDVVFSIDLPINKSKCNNGLNCIWSFFDHEYPIYSAEPNTAAGTIMKYTGERVTEWPKCIENNSCYSGHDGYDFSFNVVNGDPVLAAAAGEVSSDFDSCLGNWVKINHGSYQTLYAHLKNDPYWKRSGHVESGERIGSVGNSGSCSTGYHLHFSVFYDQNNDGVFESPDELVDPYGWRNPCNPTKNDPWTITFKDKYNIEHTGATSNWLWQFSPSICSYYHSENGQSIDTVDGVAIIVPANAINETATIAYNISPEPTILSKSSSLIGEDTLFQATIPTGHTFQLSAYYLDGSSVPLFTVPVTTTIIYTDSDIIYGDEATLGFYLWDETNINWVQIPSTIDTTSNSVIGFVSQPGILSLRAHPNNPAPAIVDISPSVFSSLEDTPIVVTGTNFLPLSTINLGIGSLDVRYISSSKLIAIIPANYAPGNYDLLVRNPDGQTALLPNSVTIMNSIFIPLCTR